jgi:ribokinase
MLEIASFSDYVVASQDFAKDLGWELTQKGLNQQRETLGCKVLSITSGERGSLNVSQNEFLEIPSFKVDAIDTTGAGDVFHGGYIYGLLKSWNLRNTAVFASAVAAMKCRKIGAQAGIPSFTEATEFLNERGYPFVQPF